MDNHQSTTPFAYKILARSMVLKFAVTCEVLYLAWYLVSQNQADSSVREVHWRTHGVAGVAG